MSTAPSPRVLLSGSTGLVGSSLVNHLRARGYRVGRLLRGGAACEPDDVAWDPIRGAIDVERLESLHAVVHLAGENVGAGRWTRAKKDRIRNSRVQGTRVLVDALARLQHPPAALLTASAVGYYGDRADEVLNEDAPPGQSFLATVCRDWEAEADRASERGIRVARFRLGLVLSPRGGALARMLPLFRWGLGGNLGRGRQYQSWITLEDAARAFVHGIEHESVRGAVNTVSPNPVTNAELTRTLASVLHRPALVPAPTFALRLGLGEFAGELLSSQRVVPGVLARTGFEFEHPELGAALHAMLS